MRLPAREIEALVHRALHRCLTDRSRLFDALDLGGCAPARTQTVLACAQRLADTLQVRAGRASALGNLLGRVVVGDDAIAVTISPAGLARALGRDAAEMQATSSTDALTLRIPARLKRCGGASKLIISDGALADDRPPPDPALLKALARAHDWFGRLASGRAGGVTEIARADGVTPSYVTRVLRLAFLAPDITQAILDGRQPPALSADRLIRASRQPLLWAEQRRQLGSTRD